MIILIAGTSEIEPSNYSIRLYPLSECITLKTTSFRKVVLLPSSDIYVVVGQNCTLSWLQDDTSWNGESEELGGFSPVGHETVQDQPTSETLWF
jgi:uncharacterized cysteine cluster protein YcgN (CxxCxxCC family)